MKDEIVHWAGLLGKGEDEAVAYFQNSGQDYRLLATRDPRRQGEEGEKRVIRIKRGADADQPYEILVGFFQKPDYMTNYP